MLERDQVWRVLHASVGKRGSTSSMCFYSAQREKGQREILEVAETNESEMLLLLSASMKAGAKYLSHDLLGRARE